MKVLLIGPHPPPHGGISVHVAGIHQHLTAAGVTCRVLDMSRIRPGLAFILTVFRHALRGWTLHFHTNGHNVKSWLLALACGLAGQSRSGCLLTLHSGMVPRYLEDARLWRRKLAAFTCSLYRQVICVSPAIADALRRLGYDSPRIEILPAFLNSGMIRSSPSSHLQGWMDSHRPLFSTALFFRPEYGFDLLVDGLARFSRLHPSFGCVVMGSGEERAEGQQLVRDAGLEDQMLLVGDVDHDTCLAVISASDIFLRPTREDGDSISVREALSMGVPVVASRVGTRPPDTILFPAGDVEQMLAKIDLAMAKKRAGQSQTGGSMDRLLEIYRQADDSEGSLCLN